MRSDPLQSVGLTKVQAGLLLIAALSFVAALVSGMRLHEMDRRVGAQARELPRLTAAATELAALRAQSGPAARVEAPENLELIPFLETAVTRAGIAKEMMSLNTDAPRPVAGRPDLIEQETRLDLKSVSAPGLLQFLGSAEKGCPALQIREIALTPLAEERVWTARMRFVIVRAAGKGG